jgi:hypothetical protein
VAAAVALACSGLGAPGAARAAEHGDIEQTRPLRLDDAYSLEAGEYLVKSGVAVGLAHRGLSRAVFPFEIDYGVTSRLQLGIATQLATDPHGLDGMPVSGDLTLDVFYHLSDETPQLPALAIDVELTAPTGVGSRGGAFAVSGIATRSIGTARVHFNAGYQALSAPRRGERDGTYSLVLGANHPLGAPGSARASLVADVYALQGPARTDATIVGFELGLRYQLGRSLVWDAGIGTEVAGPDDRSDLLVTSGFSFGF